MSVNRNSFYSYSLWAQWLAALGILLCFLLCCLVTVALIKQNLIWALLTPLLIPISQFAVSPLFTLLGLYQYLSPILLIYLPTRHSIELHHASSFDYLFLGKLRRNASSRKRLTLLYYVEGLLSLVELIEAHKVSPQVKIEATTYFVNNRTAKLLGLSLYKPSRLKRICMCLNYLDLVWMCSFTSNKFQCPAIGSLGYLKGDGHQLIRNKHKLLALYNRLKSPQPRATPPVLSASFH